MLERCAVVMILGCVAIVGGCGLKGPLYLPEDKSQEVSAQPGATDEEKKQRATSGGAPVGDATPAVPTDSPSAPSSTPPPNGN
jgi:predicted small lipoprotein YifL